MAPTQSTMIRVGNSAIAECPRHQQHLEHEETEINRQVKEAKSKDARRWWSELAKYWQHSDECNFQALRTDPLTRKILFPSHVTRLEMEDSSSSNEDLSLVVP